MDGVRWLDQDEQRAWRAYQSMQRRLTAQLSRELQADAGLSISDYEVLVALTDLPEGRLRPYELQRSLQWEQSRLSHHLVRMQRRGLVDRVECQGDRRGSLVVLTDAGRRAIEAAAPGHVAAVRRLFLDGLSHDQVAMVETLANRVLERLDGSGPGPAAPTGPGRPVESPDRRPGRDGRPGGPVPGYPAQGSSAG